ncbi:MAG: YebC/PmpR family DNA-binding transcriptional regulator [bacterium]
MSGHSKWSTIKRQKGLKDAARGAVFTRLGNMVALAARGGTDPDTNFSLRLAIDKAKAANMPMVNIERAIKRVSDKSQAAVTEVMYEGYASGGVAILVECATDNINRTYPDVKLAFSKHGGAIAEKGSVAFQFKHVGYIRVEGTSEDILMQVLDCGADDASEEDGDTLVYTDPKQLGAVRDAISKTGLKIKEAELTYEPVTTVEITDDVTEAKVMRVLEALEDLDDVVATHTNLA